MDNSAKANNQNDDVTIKSAQAQAQKPSQPAKPSQPSQPAVTPTGSPNKEMGPVGATMSEIKPSGVEVSHKLSEELEKLGIKENQDRPDLTDDHKKAGIEHASESTPVATRPSGSVQFPMTDDDMQHELKDGKGDDSKKWLAALVMKVKKVMGFDGK